jgi:hypothetical protein
MGRRTLSAVIAGFAAIAAASAAMPLPASAETTRLSAAPGFSDQAPNFDARFGVFGSAFDNAARSSMSINGEIVTLKLPLRWGASWLLPQLQAGNVPNLNKISSSLYGGLMWSVPLASRIFAEAFVGARAPNDATTATPALAALSCQPNVQAGGNLGYRMSDQWNLMLTYNHLSNSRNLGMGCGDRAPTGLSSYGARVGFSF